MMMINLHGFLTLASFARATVSLSFSGYTPAGLQSGPDLAGSTFAASASYDPVTNSVVITGSTFGRFFSKAGSAITSIPRKTSNCFLATVSLPTASNTNIQWTIRQTVGDDEDNVNEACSAAVYHQKRKKLIVTGQSERGGFLDGLYNDAYPVQAKQYGMIIDMDVSADATTPFHLVGGRVMQQSHVIYPITLAATPLDDWIYVVAQETSNIQPNAVQGSDSSASNNGQTVFTISEEVDPMRFFRYGANFSMTIQRYRLLSTASSTTLQETFTGSWRRLIATTNNAAIHVAGVTEIGDIVVVVGSTDGMGADFGGNETVIGEGTMSGFLTKRHKNAGKLVDVSGTNNKVSHRVQSINGADDWIAGMCNDPNDPDHFYIVGATGGQLNGALDGSSTNDSVEAFAMKVAVGTLDAIWTKQVGAEEGADAGTLQVRAISCAVSPNGDSVWLGGVVQNGALLKDSGILKSYGGDDVFVAKLSSEDGAVAFVRQMGSAEDDGLAMRGGLAVDSLGNGVVVGNTYGSFYRERQSSELQDQAWISDVFVTTISGDKGEIAFPVSYVAPGGSGGMSPGMIVLLIAVSVGILAFAFFAQRKSKLNRDVNTDRAKVIEFLSEFDVDDVELKHSATGGWHCSYSNDLARGRNRRAERESSYGNLVPPKRSMPTGSDPLLTAPLTNSSVLQDSLFMNEDDSSDYGGGLGGGRFGDSRSSQRHGYNGLVDAYNSTWDDRRAEQETDVWGNEIL